MTIPAGPELEINILNSESCLESLLYICSVFVVFLLCVVCCQRLFCVGGLISLLSHWVFIVLVCIGLVFLCCSGAVVCCLCLNVWDVVSLCIVCCWKCDVLGVYSKRLFVSCSIFVRVVMFQLVCKCSFLL